MMLNLSFEQLDSLTKSEYDLLTYINNNPKEVAELTIKDLARTVYLSTTSIVRFCKKIGYDSFSSFKYDMKNRLNNEKNVKSNNNMSVVESFRDSIINTIDLIDEVLIEEIASLLVDRKAFVYGKGTNFNFLDNFVTQLCLYNCITLIHRDSNVAALYAETLTSEDVCIVLSISGETESTYRVAQTAKSKGATVIALTSYVKSKLHKLADYTLYFDCEGSICKVDSNGPTVDTRSRFQIVYLLDIILRKVYEKKCELINE